VYRDADTSEHRLSRRFALKGAGLLAAALTAPAAAVLAPAIAEASEEEIVHTTGCFHRKYSRPGDRDELDRLRAAFDATGPTEEQRSLHIEMQDKLGEVLDEEYDRFVEGLERHLPGLAPAIRLVAYHVIEAGFRDREC
jgi:hypothetical protein